MHRSQEDIAAAPEAGEQTTTFGPLQLSPGTTRTNISGYYWLALTSIMTFTFIPAAQTALLTSILGVPKGEQGSIVGTAGLISEIVLIAAVGLAGAWSDRLGRRPIVVGGYVLLGLGVGMAPFLGSVVPYYLARGVAAVGVAMVTVMLTAVVADYVRDTTRGRANGIVGFCNGLGALVTFFVLIKLPDIFEGGGMDTIAALRATYLIVGGLALLTAILMGLTLRGGLATTHSEHIPIPRLLREGVAEIRRPGVSFAYLSAFVARADLALVGAYLTLWAQQYGTQQLGLSEAEALDRKSVV